MDQASLMDLAESSRDRNCDAQEARSIQWLAKLSIERRTAGILKRQRHAVIVVRQRDWSCRPRIVQIVPQSVFVNETIEAVRGWLFRSGKHDEHRITVAIGDMVPSSVEDAITVRPRHLETVITANVVPREGHPPNSTARTVRR
jgi:hypothetical protein